MRILELETEVRAREQDLAQYREHLSRANARLENLIGQVQGELKIAAAMQKALVPTEFPNIPGFEFSTKFIPSMVQGGDYFDIFSHEDRLRFGLVMSSSTGATLSALFMSVLLKFTSQMEARKGAEPHLIVERIAKEISPGLEEGSEANLFYGLVDRRNYDLSYCCLGGINALHQVFSNGEVKVLEAQQGALNSRSKMAFVAAKINLNPRDKLILVSRGVTDTKNLEGETFGLPRLSKSISEAAKKSIHEVRNQILHDAQKFSAGQELQRDQTVVVVEVKDKVIKLASHRDP